jgi:hypothetical protein
MSTLASLVNRYSFTGDSGVTSAIDSVGGENGTLAGNAAISGNQLVLDGVDDWVSLPYDVLSTYTSASIEAWFTLNTVSNYARLFDFGDTSGGNGNHCWFYSPSYGSNSSRLAINTVSGEQFASVTKLLAGTTYHIVCVYDAAAGQMRLYRNGSPVASASVTSLLSDVHRVNAYIGKSNYSADPELKGSINEFRIHNNAMTNAQVAASYSAGPDVVVSEHTPPRDPSPADGSQSLGLNQTLSWTSDTAADITGHRVYLGTDSTSVLNATTSSTGIYQGTTAAGVTSFPVTLQGDTQYYWRIEDVLNTGSTLNGAVWAFHTYYPKAINLSPADGTIGISISGTTLSWTGSAHAASHRVYLGLSPETLQLVADNYTQTSWATGTLNYSKTYYWRIDERESGGAIFTGDVWSLSTLQRPQTCIPGDLDGDCYVGINDLLLFADQWLEGSGSDADFVGDDGVDATDFAVMAENWLTARSRVIINEIHYNPDLAQELVEFVELYNRSGLAVDISGWQFTNGITYTFPAGTTIAADGYLVVAEDPTPAVTDVTITGKYGTSASLVKGPFIGNLSNEGETITLSDAQGNSVDKVDYQLGFPWPTVGDALTTAGTGASIQFVNPVFDNDLGGNWRSAYPTPGAANTVVYADNLPPCIRQVEHSPQQPKAGQAVTITAKVTDTDGVGSVTLKYQLNDPGSYIPITLPNLSTTTPTLPNTAYETGWIDLAMHDDGLNGDVEAGDGIYTVQVPTGIQTHRRLIRYRIAATDTGARSVTVPYADDPQPNFAYFVYNGVPAWTGNGVTYSSEVLGSLPIYHLLSRATDVAYCQWNEGYWSGSRWDDGVYHFVGTLVYDGKVYDHVPYHVRGQASTFTWGKNKWKFNFTRGHYFQAQDDYGKKYANKWNNLNVGTGACPWWQYPHPSSSWNQGTGGMLLNECLSMRLYNIAGATASNTNYFHFRIVDDEAESGATQYDGDFWGLYFAIEEPDGRFLKEHSLADGNIYKMDGSAAMMNQGSTQVTNYTDINTFTSGQTSSPTQAWWEANVNLDRYYSFKTVGIATNNSDPRPQQNCLYYCDPTTGKWDILPWDLELTYEWGTHYGQWEYITDCLNYSALNIAYQNRARELVDLLFDNNNGGWRQTDQLVDEMAAVIANNYNGQRFIDAEQAMWDNHPRVNYKGYWYTHNEYFTQPGNSANWDFMVAYYKQYLTQTGMSGFLSGSYGLNSLIPSITDSLVPNTPTVSAVAATITEGYPINDLVFNTSTFGGSGTFAASKWRIAEVEPYTPITPPDPGQSQTNDLITANETWNYYRAISAEPSDPVEEWRTLGFDDSSWQTGQTSIGYGDSDDETDLSLQSPPMQGNYTTVYLRKTFEITNLADIDSFALSVRVDDGCVIWINGTEVARPHCTDGFKAWDGLSGNDHEAGWTWENIALPMPYTYFTEGTNIIAVHVLNVSKDSSSDLTMDLKLTAIYSSEPLEPLPLQKIKRGKYEIQTLWESPEIANASQLTVKIPATVVKPGKMYRVRCRMKDNTGRWSHWSDPNQFTAGVPLSVGILEDLRITEVMYNPPQPSAAEIAAGFTDNDEFEFIEIKNRSVDETLDLTYVALTNGVTFNFAGSAIISLAPGQFALVVKNAAAFNLRYPGLSGHVAGVYTGNLSNSGEKVELVDTLNGTIADFDYNDGYGWPISADGAGHSMIPLESALPGQPNGSLRYAGNWRASTYIKGSPGADDPAPIASVMINEVMAHTDYTNPSYPDYDSNDWIELYNPTGSAIALGSNWYLSDNPDNLKKWALTPAGSISSHGWVSFDEITGFHSPISSGFGLDKVGECVLLSYLPGNSNDRVVDYVKFGGQYNTVSTGRYPDGGNYWFFLANPGTRNTANANPVQRPVVISEIMYNPLNGTTNEEYIELTNTTGSAVDLYNDYGTWRLDNAVSYSFPAGKSIPAGGKIVVVPFDPAVETTRLAAFNTAYGCSLVANSTIFGPWTGDLSNGGERIALQEPEEADPPQTPTTWWIITDQVIYGDYSPWPIEPDGTGPALGRISSSASASGDDPANWQSVTPSPGN